MRAPLRKLLLASHVVSAVGWLGAVSAFLVLSIAGIVSGNAEVVRGAYISMDLISVFAVIPLCLVALATGLLQALATPWGLIRHYWIVVKLALGSIATIALLLHQFAYVGEAARLVPGASRQTLFGTEFAPLQTELVRAPALAIVLLLTAVALAIYKPWGLTSYGRRRLEQRSVVTPRSAPTALPSGLKFVLAAIGVAAAVFILLHLTGHGMPHHSG